MKKKIVLLLMAVLAAVCMFAGCEIFKEELSVEEFTVEAVGTDSIKIDFPWYRPRDYVVYEYSLDGENWEDEPEDRVLIIDDLTPGQTYTVYVRIKSTRKIKQSEPVLKQITLDKESGGITQVGIERTERQVAVTGYTDDMEVCYENDEWISAGTYVYSDSGVKSIKVRYKETATTLAGETQELSIMVNGLYKGTGKKDDPFLITKPEHLTSLEDAISAFNLRDLSTSAVFVQLVNDVSFADMPVLTEPIKTAHREEPGIAGNHDAKYSCVVFNGNGKCISDVKMNFECSDFTEYKSFGFFEEIGIIYDITFKNCDMTVNLNNGTSSAYVSLITPNCQKQYVKQDCGVEKCYSDNCNITLNVKNCSKACEISGLMEMVGPGGIVRNAGFSGVLSVETDATSSVMIYGMVKAFEIYDSYFEGNISLNGKGSIYGIADADPYNCYFDGEINASGDIKSIYAISYGMSKNCYVTGTLNLTAKNTFSVYMLGYSSAENCYSSMDINVITDWQVSGIIQSVNTSSTNSYFAGNIDVKREQGEQNVGTVSIFFGTRDTDWFQYYENFYFVNGVLSDNLENEDYCRENNIVIDKQPKAVNIFSSYTLCWNKEWLTENLGWDFDTVWDIPVSGEYPVLRNATKI